MHVLFESSTTAACLSSLVVGVCAIDNLPLILFNCNLILSPQVKAARNEKLVWLQTQLLFELYAPHFYVPHVGTFWGRVLLQLLPWCAKNHSLAICGHVTEYSRTNEGRLAGAHLQRHQRGKLRKPLTGGSG